MTVDSIKDIVKIILSYDNKDKLSWTKVYYNILKSLNLEDKINDYNLLNNVIHEITVLGYDIIPIPFKLEKYK